MYGKSIVHVNAFIISFPRKFFTVFFCSFQNEDETATTICEINFTECRNFIDGCHDTDWPFSDEQEKSSKFVVCSTRFFSFTFNKFSVKCVQFTHGSSEIESENRNIWIQ